ncbi:MAG TPA: hypothetical protein VFU47_00715, partial [Armatimonadota bacterium]|nr:hypothetical protein [Armatimonadota bacterium]
APQPDGRREGGFYLGNRKESESLSDALDDIRKAWLNGDVERIRSRFKAETKIRIYPKGEYKYSVESRDFSAMIQDAMKRIDTIAFEFDRPQSEDPNRAFVTGKHTFVDADQQRQTTYISYTLERLDGRWYITGAGSSSSPIAKHQG